MTRMWSVGLRGESDVDLGVVVVVLAICIVRRKTGCRGVKSCCCCGCGWVKNGGAKGSELVGVRTAYEGSVVGQSVGTEGSNIGQGLESCCLQINAYLGHHNHSDSFLEQDSDLHL